MQYELVEAGHSMSVILQNAQEDRGAVWLIGTITFPLMVVLALSGCAPARAPALQAPVSQALGGPTVAIVAAVRPIPALAMTGNDPQAAILAAMGVSPAARAPDEAVSEIILRRDDGEAQSVVQPDAADLAPGERVMVVPAGSVRRLMPAPPAH